MSYDLFAQAFAGGDAAPMPSSAFAVFLPYVDRADSARHHWHVHTPDGGEADIHADVTPGTFSGFMINHFSAGQPLDLLAEFAVRAGAVIMVPGGPWLLTAEAQRGELPDDLPGTAVLIRDGGDLRQALELR
ncbi:hypothetical protein ABJI51_24840 [Amycolatopsis sp. NEAU-NG30]|uniref:Uncharacterized protein n=1 Tax=Amycolatopsis melonis TaxID=3156488 RepID=A0ABV0LJ48_9PSEU